MSSSIVVFAMGGVGHLQRLHPVAAALVTRGVDVTVFTDVEFAGAVHRVGARFADLYAGRPIEAADGESRPVPCRWVSFAARFADEIAGEAALLRPTLVMSDSFAFVGRVVAGMLGLVHVDLRSGHDVDPARFVEGIEAERVRISPRCHEAVSVLRDRYGWEDASPFSYGTHKSGVLNICSEPEVFVSATTRRALEPIAYFGSLPSLTEIERLQRPAAPAWFGSTRSELQVFVSFGTVAWWY